MKETPMLMSTPMVQAYQKGLKTQTRRVVKPQPKYSADWALKDMGDGSVWIDKSNRVWCPYGQVGDRLWFRETWSPWADRASQIAVRGESEACLYKADYMDGCPSVEIGGDYHWHPSIFMPKEFARYRPLITGLRCERLQDISPHELSTHDLLAEGLPKHNFGIDYSTSLERHVLLEDFKKLWNSINGKRKIDITTNLKTVYPHSWQANPWVWVVSFEGLS